MNPLLIALDVDTTAQADQLASVLEGAVGGLKIGSQLFTSEGPSIVRALGARGHRVFLDLKFHDIPNTVAGAVRAATRLGVWMLTIHTSGGAAMMRAAVDAADAEARAAGVARPLIVGVTVLTSLDQAAIGEVGVERDLARQVEALAQLAKRSGIDGIVCSPQEAAQLRASCGPDFLLVTPGIRPAADSGTRTDDQARTLSAAEAIAAGANYLVVGRPVVKAADPRAAALALAGEIREVEGIPRP
jgi:orotidine-5'-phosphate decarboxylase